MSTPAIDIGSSSGTKKVVDVLITTEPDEPLTDEQKTGIINIIKDSISDDFTVIVDLKEKQRADLVDSLYLYRGDGNGIQKN